MMSRATRTHARALRALMSLVLALPLMADSCSQLGTTIPVKAYSDACTQGSAAYPVTLTPTSGTGRWQQLMGKPAIKARIILTNNAGATTDCSTARGIADLRGGLPPLL